MIPLPSFAADIDSVDQPGGTPWVIGASTSFWNRKLADNHPIVVDTNNYAQKVANQARYSTTSTPVAGYYDPPFQITLNRGSYSVPLWVMPPGYPTRKVTFVVGGVSQPDSYSNGLAGLCNNVPIPLIADLPAGHTARLWADGTDQEVAFWQPSTDTMWEFWVFDGDETAGYTTRYGGVINPVSTNDGTLPHLWGAKACSLMAVGGIIMAQEFINGVIPHAINLALPVTKNSHLAPATRNDSAALVPSGDNRDAVPEGCIFRLPATTTINPSWSKFLRLLVAAVRDYGLVVCDTAGVVQFQAEDPRSAGTMFSNVTTYPNWGNFGADFITFPWEQLQQVAYP